MALSISALMLYIIIILHQTATSMTQMLCNHSLYIIIILHQTATMQQVDVYMH